MRGYSQRSAVYVPLPKPDTLSLDLNAALAHRTSLLSPAKPTSALRHIWIITGPAGCGKSSIAAYLAKSLNLPYIEGDDYHPIENVKKMSEGIPLNDEDRWGWLDTLRHKASEELEAGAMGCVVTCSALKRRYRDFIRQVGQAEANIVVRFVYLRADVELLVQRVKARQNHFMKDDMVRSQFVALEEPDSSEPDVVSVDVSNSLTEVQEAALRLVEINMKESTL
jgi:gluconokinase